MSVLGKLKHEFKSVAVATLYFALWYAVLIVIKTLILAEYQIEFNGFMKAMIWAAVTAKVMLVLEHVPLGRWLAKQPAWVDVVLRTLLYIAGVFVALLGEKMFHERHEYSSLGTLLVGAFESANAATVWVNTLAVGWGILLFNAFAVVRLRLGTKALLNLFTSPMPQESKGEA